MKTLPNKPSELLMVAMEDLEAVERSKKFSICMADWVHKNNSTCSVCHAGAVMVKSLDAIKLKKDDPCDFSSDVFGKLQAINEIRQGYIFQFGLDLGLDKHPFFVSPKFAEVHCGYDQTDGGNLPGRYSESSNEADFEAYKDWIVSFIGILQAEGL